MRLGTRIDDLPKSPASRDQWREVAHVLPPIVFALAASSLLAACGGAPELSVDDAWVRSAPPSAGVLAGYCTLRNRADAPVTIVAAHSSSFERIEMHETVTRNGITGMRRIERLVVPGGGSLELAPGGRHLMLIGPHRPYSPDDQLEIVLELDGGAERAFTAEVRSTAP